MKKQLLILIAFFALSISLSAQSISTSSYACSPTLSCSLTGSVTSATSYSWSSVPATNLVYNYGIYASLSLPASGVYTIVCQPYSGATPLAPISTTVNFVSAPQLTVNGITTFTTYNICSGSTLSLVAQGATSYTWTGGIQSASVAVSPSVNTFYTVQGSNGSCVSTMDVSINVAASAPVLSLGNSPTSLCNGVANLVVNGATTYSWSNGPTTASNPVTATGCYSVSGTNICGTSTAVICVTGSATTPTLSLSGLPTTLCANNTVTLSASGANSYSMVTYVNNTFTSVNSGSFVFTPTVSGAACFTVTGNNNGCLGQATSCGSVLSTGAISIGGPTLYCAGGTGSLSASGAVSYTWNTGANGPVLTFTPSTSTCYTVIGTTACGGTIMGVRCINVIANPTLSISGNTAVCAGSTNIFTATGAPSYTWMNTNYNYLGSGSTLALGTTAGCFFVSSSASGCSAYSNTLCVSTLTTPTVSIASSNSIVCAGSTVTMTASGNAPIVGWSNGIAGASIVVSPTASICYSVVATTTAGCSGIASRCIVVLPVPANGIQTATQVCTGSAALLTAAGANTYSWSTGATTSTLSVIPTANTCYTVTGFNANGCSSSTVHCVSLLPTLPVAINGANTVCLGSSIGLSASGGLIYNWSTGQISNTISLLPTASTVITVSSTASNGCVSSASTAITVNSNCSDVWPGDANSDGVVSSSDFLEIGAAFNSTGAARTPGGNSWTSQYATNWTGTVSSGKNKAHADCNGDGTVNSSDTLAIYNNLTLTHAFRPGAPAANTDLYFESENSVAYVGVWNKVDVMLGNSTTPTYNLLGLSFDLRFDNSLLDAGQIYLEYNSGSAINSGNQAISLRKTDLNNGVLYTANVRKDQINVNAGGKIASVYFKVSPLAGETDVISVTAQNVKMITASASLSDLQSGVINLPVSRSVGVREEAQMPVFSVAPNPAQHSIRINGNGKAFKIVDLSGRTVVSGNLNNNTTVDVSSLASGVYFVEVQNETGSSLKKLIITE